MATGQWGQYTGDSPDLRSSERHSKESFGRKNFLLFQRGLVVEGQKTNSEINRRKEAC